jgi:acyl-coenzyme A synthetase/AMP-(fatty) acid ligase
MKSSAAVSRKAPEGVPPSAIEKLIAAHPDVLRCVVVPAGGRDDDERTLTAHYVLRPTATLSATALYGYLAQRLGISEIPVRLRRHAAFPPTVKATIDLAS